MHTLKLIEQYVVSNFMLDNCPARTSFVSTKGALLLLVMFAFSWQPAQAQIAWSQDSWPNTDFAMASIKLNSIRGGGPPKDGIPAIDNPKFDSVSYATQWIDPLEPVIAIEVDGEAKAYPLQILTYHEIVNDEISGIPVSVTFCPLCNASIVFDRRHGDELLDFGTTGLLRMSDLVMYDRQTESWWQQFSGKAIVGKYVGDELARIPSSIISYQSFVDSYPEGKVLNRETGFSRPYGRNPYSGYDKIDQRPFLFDRKIDDRLPPMERVLGITHQQHNKIYPFATLKEQRLINDQILDMPVAVFATGELLSVLDSSKIADSRLLVEATAWNRTVPSLEQPLTFSIDGDSIVDDQTGSSWNVMGRALSGELKGTQLKPIASGVHFAFAWLAFNPDSEIFTY